MRLSRWFGFVAAAAVSAGVVAATPTAASAEPSPPGCPKGYFCAYSGPNQRGYTTLRAKGNWSGRVATRSVFNNGKRMPGADHVDLRWTYRGKTWSMCLHYNPGPGIYKVNFVPGVRVTGVKWRGECATSRSLPRNSGISRG